MENTLDLGTKRIAVNAGWAFMGFAVPTLMMFIGIPLFIHFLGVRVYGLWTLANTILGLIGFLNLGLGDATTKYVAEYSAKGRQEDLTRVIASTLTIYTVLGIIGTIVLWYLSPFLSENIFHLSGKEFNQAVAVFHIVSLGFASSISFTSILGIFNGLLLFRVSQTLVMIRSIAVVTIGGIVLYMGLGILGLAISMVSILWIVWLIGLLIGLHKIPWVPLRELKLVMYMKKVLSFGVYTMINSVATMLYSQLDKLLIGSLVGLEAVSYYSVSKNIASKIHMLCASTASVLMPFFSSREAGERSVELLDPLFRSWRISLLVSLTVIVLAVASAPWLLDIWVGKEFATNSIFIYYTFIAVYTLNAVSIVPFFYLIGRGEPAKVALATVLCSLMTVTGIAWGAAHYGVLGAAVASLIHPLARMLFLPKMAIRITDGASMRRDLFPGLWLPLSIYIISALMGLIAGWLMATITGYVFAGLITSLFIPCLIIFTGHIAFQRSTNSYFKTTWDVINSIFYVRKDNKISTTDTGHYNKIDISLKKTANGKRI